MVREMPRTTEVTDFLRSITPFFPEREEEGGAGVDQEGEGEEGEGPLSSTVLHRVNDLELSPEREEEGEGGGEGEGGSLSSNDEDYQESFQDLQVSNFQPRPPSLTEPNLITPRAPVASFHRHGNRCHPSLSLRRLRLSGATHPTRPWRVWFPRRTPYSAPLPQTLRLGGRGLASHSDVAEVVLVGKGLS